MQKKNKQLSLLAAALAALVITGSSVLALPGQANVHAQQAAGVGHAGVASQAEAHQPLQATNARANAAAHLSAARLKSCQNRQQAISNIMARIADRGQKQLTLFTTIATRVENFYTDKGNTLSNYDQLVADVNTQQTTAQNAVNATKTDSTGFSCDSSNPKAFVDSFKTSLKSEISALKDYRLAVKNLTVGVKSVQSTTSTSDQTSGGNQ